MIIYILNGILALSGLFYLIGKTIDEAKCYACKHYGDKFYMIKSPNNKYKHYSC